MGRQRSARLIIVSGNEPTPEERAVFEQVLPSLITGPRSSVTLPLFNPLHAPSAEPRLHFQAGADDFWTKPITARRRLMPARVWPSRSADLPGFETSLLLLSRTGSADRLAGGTVLTWPNMHTWASSAPASLATSAPPTFRMRSDEGVERKISFGLSGTDITCDIAAGILPASLQPAQPLTV